MRDDVLDAHPDLDIRVLAIWVPVIKTDNREAAVRATSVLDDPRVTQFYDPRLRTSRWFKSNVVDKIKRLGSKRVFGSGITWDAFFLYGANATWNQRPKSHLTAGATVVAEFDRLTTEIEKLADAR